MRHGHFRAARVPDHGEAGHHPLWDWSASKLNYIPQIFGLMNIYPCIRPPCIKLQDNRFFISFHLSSPFCQVLVVDGDSVHALGKEDSPKELLKSDEVSSGPGDSIPYTIREYFLKTQLIKIFFSGESASWVPVISDQAWKQWKAVAQT